MEGFDYNDIILLEAYSLTKLASAALVVELVIFGFIDQLRHRHILLN